jgi:hypothetical protein
MVLDATINGRADALVTQNAAQDVPLTPGDELPEG